MQRGVPTTSYTGGFVDLAGFNSTDVLQITLMNANTKVRIHFSINASTQWDTQSDPPYNIRFRLKRSASGYSDVDLNADTSTITSPSLAHVQLGHNTSTDQGHLTNYEIYYIDDLTGYSVGDTITYVPQIAGSYGQAGSFYLNTTEGPNSNFSRLMNAPYRLEKPKRSHWTAFDREQRGHNNNAHGWRLFGLRRIGVDERVCRAPANPF